MVPVALITAADSVCHPMPAALSISRQRRRSIYPHRGLADRERTNENNDKRWRNRARTVGNSLSDCGRAGLVAVTGGAMGGAVAECLPIG